MFNEDFDYLMPPKDTNSDKYLLESVDAQVYSVHSLTSFINHCKSFTSVCPPLLLTKLKLILYGLSINYLYESHEWRLI